jgi:hypothetical protein
MLHHFSFLELVHYVIFEWLGEGLVVSSSERAATHLGEVLAAKTFALGNLDVRLEVRSLHLKLRMLTMHQWANHVRVSKEWPWLR